MPSVQAHRNHGLPNVFGSFIGWDLRIMSLQFTAESIFEIGVQIEKNGKAFYQHAAATVSDASLKTLLVGLADWENGHITLFEELKAELPDTMREDNLFDPDNEFFIYLQAAADSHVFISTTDIAGLAARCTTPDAIFEMALRFEKDSVVYYTTLKEMVANQRGKQRIDTLIREELKHIDMLNKQRKAL
jgi:rubrerythrin